MAAIKRAFADRIQQVKCLDHRAGWQHVDLELLVRHFVDLFGKVQRVFMKNIFGWPSALKAQRDGRGGLGNGGKSQ